MDNKLNELGINEQEKFKSGDKPRGETSEATQRPVAMTKTVKDKRGTFKDKC